MSEPFYSETFRIHWAYRTARSLFLTYFSFLGKKALWRQLTHAWIWNNLILCFKVLSKVLYFDRRRSSSSWRHSQRSSRTPAGPLWVPMTFLERQSQSHYLCLHRCGNQSAASQNSEAAYHVELWSFNALTSPWFPLFARGPQLILSSTRRSTRGELGSWRPWNPQPHPFHTKNCCLSCMTFYLCL